MGKIETYIGFAIKSGKILYGLDNIKAYKRKIHLFLLCPTASENLTNEAKFIASKREKPIVVTQTELEKLIHKNNCKLAAILDFNLANAVLDNIRR